MDGRIAREMADAAAEQLGYAVTHQLRLRLLVRDSINPLLLAALDPSSVLCLALKVIKKVRFRTTAESPPSTLS